MKITKTTDTILHVIFPLAAGFFLYYGAGQGWFSQDIKNYLPDGLWAYAFISAILIAWNRKTPFYWIIIAFVSLLLVELLQFKGIMAGTADLWDVLLYYLFAGMALLINRFSLRTNNIKTTV